MTGVTDMVKMMVVAKGIFPILKYISEAPKPLLEEEPKLSELDVDGKKLFMLQCTFAFDTKKQREEFLKRDEDLQDLMTSLKKFAEKKKEK